MTTDDMDLVREYALHGSEDVFATLVSRHVNVVYSVGLRQLGDAHLAEEVTQAVFIILARKAGSLGRNTILPAWLCRTAHYVACDASRSQRRRQFREQEAYMQSQQNEPDAPPLWAEIAPLLDSALAGLRERDHNAIVLRFFEGKDFKDVGAAMGVSENAARKRVNHSLEKLRRYFSRRGMALTTSAIAGAMLAHSVKAAPAPLAKSVTAVAVTKGAIAGGSTLTLIKGALKIMARTKIKIAVAAGMAVLFAAGGGMAIYRTYHPGKIVHVHNLVRGSIPGRAGGLSKGLIGLWSGEDNAVDTAGGNNGHLNNVSFVDGVVGRAFSFSGNGSGIRIADDRAYELTRSLSIEGSVRPRGDGYVIFFRGDHRPGLDPYCLSMDGHENLSFAICAADGTTVTIQTPLALGAWLHVAAVVDDKAGTVNIYTNGVLAAQTNTAVRPFGPLLEDETPGVGIGNVNDGGNNFPFVGDIDEIALYNRALSPTEVNALYEENAAHAGP